MHRSAFVVIVIGASLGGGASALAGEVINLDIRTVNSHVYDGNADILYMTTQDGTIERYSVAAGVFLTSFSGPGVSFNGIDVSADGSRVYAIENWRAAPGTGVVRVFDTSDGSQTGAFYPLEQWESSRGHDVVLTNQGYALTTGNHRLTTDGIVPMRKLYESDLTYSDPIRDVFHASVLFRSRDRGTVLYFDGTNEDSGTIGVYDAASDSFIAERSLGLTNGGRTAAVSRDGQQIAVEDPGTSMIIMDRMLNEIGRLEGYDGGVGFSPIANIVFAGSLATDEIVAFDSNTLEELERYQLTQRFDFSQAHLRARMSFTDDGRTLFVSTDRGISVLSVIPAPSSAGVLSWGLVLGGRRRRR